MNYNFNDADQREAAMAEKWAECCEENTLLRQQLARTKEWFAQQLKEPLHEDDLATLREEYEALAALEPK